MTMSIHSGTLARLGFTVIFFVITIAALLGISVASAQDTRLQGATGAGAQKLSLTRQCCPAIEVYLLR